MSRASWLTCCLAAVIWMSSIEHCRAAAGTASVASQGRDVTPRSEWAEGIVELLNDPARTEGWNPWFTEWPNDVCHYAFEVQTMEDVNRLVDKLSKIETEVRHVHLSFLPEPDSLGWVTRLPKGNGTAVVYSHGDQARIDRWYQHVRKPFGKIEFTAAPVAAPPTLTIFAQHDKIDLDQLKIPDGIEVSAGYLPGPFLRWNDKREQAAAASPPVAKEPELDEATQRARERIEAFLKQHAEAKKRHAPG